MNVTRLITLEMRLKPGFVQTWPGILDLYPTSFYFDVLFVWWDLCWSLKNVSWNTHSILFTTLPIKTFLLKVTGLIINIWISTSRELTSPYGWQQPLNLNKWLPTFSESWYSAHICINKSRMNSIQNLTL